MNLTTWTNSTIYLVMIDRFFNGIAANDNFGWGEYDPTDADCFQGGDLEGLITKLKYIKDLGFDAIWITPPLYNQWIRPNRPGRGYHGYWTYDFEEIDPHFGDKRTYQELVRRAHEIGLRVIQDIVIQHTGDYFTVLPEKDDPSDPATRWRKVEGVYPPEGPNDPLFSKNNPMKREDSKADVYHWTPIIKDFSNPNQRLNYALDELDDLNLDNAEVRNRLKSIYNRWIEFVDIDGFRIDTVYHTPPECYTDLLYGVSDSPGMKEFAQQKGKEDFFVFGEVLAYDLREIAPYVQEKRLDAAIDFPLTQELGRVFFEQAPTEQLRDCLEARRYNRPLWVTCFDNHDMARARARADWRLVKQALVALFTLPGIPCIYYGTEHEFEGCRQNMFDEAYYLRQTPQRDFLRSLTRFRKENPLFASADVKVVASSLHSGILAYEIVGPEERTLVVFNTAPCEMFFGLPTRYQQQTVLLMSDPPVALKKEYMILPGSSYVVVKAVVDKTQASFECREPRSSFLSIDSCVCYATKDGKERARIGFRLEDPHCVKQLFVLFDSNYEDRIPIYEDFTKGIATFSTSEIEHGSHKVSLLAEMNDGSYLHSEAIEKRITRASWTKKGDSVDGKSQHGIKGNLEPYIEHDQQMVMERVDWLVSHKDLKLSLKMAKLTNCWNPPNGYDHVYLSVFFDFPNIPGKVDLPKLNYRHPGFSFNAGAFLFGWAARLYSAEGSSPTSYGHTIAAEVEQRADPAAGTIEIYFPRYLFKDLETLSGVKVLITTWDGDAGELRKIKKEKSQWEFGLTDGSDPEDTPKVYNWQEITL